MFGQMEGNMMENGKATICMAKVSILGRTVEDMKVNT